ncbi:uncharacterized protein LOC126572165, partial [Anopheles aquasalis]|uniref:uncharacterized protein LOC126572165 n=1 Tax=Anopheles aquasalis TaxID=42839 RepID=UPI00215A81E6
CAGNVHYSSHHQQQHQNHHPWNVKDGWVTLEAVPWSESKVSKWQAANGGDGTKKHRPSGTDKYWNAAGDGGIDSEENGGSKYKPIAAIYPTGSSSIGASSYYQGEQGAGDSAEDYGGYGTIKNRPKANGVKQPQTQPQTQPDSLYNRRRPVVTLYSERPDGPQVDRWYEGPQATVATAPSADPYDTMKAYHHQNHGASSGTAHRDIITDGRPPNFPKFNPEQHAGDVYGSSVTASDQRVRPVSYPDRGNGEWVLISTTKGYQYPKRRHGQRAITFSPATSTSHQTVKLTVLPMKNALDMTTSHNGLIEVSSSTQTVEDAVKEQQQQHNKRKGPTPSTMSPAEGISNALPTRRKQKKKQSLAAAAAGGGSFSVMHRRDAAQDSSAVLAAVGAGMVPATMAILAPMVLGKKK